MAFGQVQTVRVSGTSYQQEIIKFFVDRYPDSRLHGDPSEDEQPWPATLRMILIPEPTNKFDKNAVCVTLPRDSQLLALGFLPSDLAPIYQPWVRAADEGGLACPGYFVGGHDERPTVGVRIQLPILPTS
ncbi:MAG: hypothetical protein QOK39_2677 [Acidimicrobiaceae bacterium]|nr:hypothetical protein [Acidimicrobiaceae bacterium]